MDLSASSTQYYTYLLNLVGGSNNKLLTVLITITICIISYPLYYLYQYRSSIKQRVKEIEKNVKLVKVIRNKNANIHNRRVTCLELDPSFISNNPQWNMISLGEYHYNCNQLMILGSINYFYKRNWRLRSEICYYSHWVKHMVLHYCRY